MAFGRGPLSHPLLVEAIETEFIPVAVRNNVDGAEAEILARFEEPAWNNPVMRFLDGGGRDVLPRRDRIWSAGDTARRLAAALEAAGRAVPPYLRLACAELAPAGRSRAVFAMHCFWEGEARLGALDGVLATRAGWLAEREVVEVIFDPARLAYGPLVRRALELDCARRIFTVNAEQLRQARALAPDRAVPAPATPRDAEAGDGKYHLRQSPLRYLPLTPLQAARVNSDLAAGKAPARWLSPRQQHLARRVEEVLAVDPDALSGLELAGPDGREEPDALGRCEARLRARLASAAGREKKGNALKKPPSGDESPEEEPVRPVRSAAARSEGSGPPRPEAQSRSSL